MTDPALRDGEPGDLLDAFVDLSGWSAIASGQAQLAIAQEDGPRGKSMRLDFDFHGGGGFVVARKEFRRPMPSSWAFRMQVRGAAPANKLELKLADPSGRNVWWFHRDAFEFPAAWQTLRIRSRLLGLRPSRSFFTIDPVLPRSLDGLRAGIELAGVPVEIVYAIGNRGHGPTALRCNGTPLAFETEANPYRAGGAVVAMDALRARLAASGNTLVVTLR